MVKEKESKITKNTVQIWRQCVESIAVLWIRIQNPVLFLPPDPDQGNHASGIEKIRSTINIPDPHNHKYMKNTRTQK
jgi:hypothetical protein